MVVVCPECGARFSLEESRIPGAVAKVRCSRCRHVFRITRDGQVVSPDWELPEDKSQETPTPQEVQAGTPAPPAPDSAESPPGPEKHVASEESAPTPPAAASVEGPASSQTLRGWLWLPALLLAVVVGLGWWFLQGKSAPRAMKPLTDVVQRLKGKWRPQGPPGSAVPDPAAGASAPAPTVVTPPPLPVPAPDLSEVPVDWAQAHYQGLVNNKAGQLLIIQGEVINKGKDPRGPIRLRATLTDYRHQPLREEVVYAGTTLSDTELKTLNPDEIKGWLLRPGGRSLERVLNPGKKQPFTVVFFGVSDNLAETQSGFQLVVVEGPVVPGKAAHQ